MEEVREKLSEVRSDRARFGAALDRLKGFGWDIKNASAVSDESGYTGPVITLPDDFEDYFSADGSLGRELLLKWVRGSSSRLQVVFAEEGLVLDVPLGEDDGDALLLKYPQNGSDLCRIIRAFDELRRKGYVAEPNLARTSTDGWQEVNERLGDREKRAVFWNMQAHEDSFGDDGTLCVELPLQWVGDPEVIANALNTTGFEIIVPRDERKVFFIDPSGEGEDEENEEEDD